jgi:hypothetical protein
LGDGLSHRVGSLLGGVLRSLRNLTGLIGDPAEWTSALLLAAGESAYGILDGPTGRVLRLVGDLTRGLLGLPGRVLRPLRSL